MTPLAGQRSGLIVRVALAMGGLLASSILIAVTEGLRMHRAPYTLLLKVNAFAKTTSLGPSANIAAVTMGVPVTLRVSARASATGWAAIAQSAPLPVLMAATAQSCGSPNTTVIILAADFSARLTNF